MINLKGARIYAKKQNDFLCTSPIYSDELCPYYDISTWEEDHKSIFTNDFYTKYERVTKEFEEMQEQLKEAQAIYEKIREEEDQKGEDNED